MSAARPIRATALRAWAARDPLLDWLARHGRDAGFEPDPPSDARYSMSAFLFAQGRRFEAGIMGLLGERIPIQRIARDPDDLDDPALAGEVRRHLAAGVPALAAVPLHADSLGAVGIADLVVRRDLLASLFDDPGAVASEETTMGGYAIVDCKFTTLHLGAEGDALASSHLAAMLQVAIYARALAELSGEPEGPAYLLGRSWDQGSGRSFRRGSGALERLARVRPDSPVGRDGHLLAETLAAGLAWHRRLAEEGAGWAVLPEPTHPELRPNMKHPDDGPWHRAKARIARETAELTLLPGVGPDLRDAALVRGLARWDDPAVTPDSLGLGPKNGLRTAAVLTANREPGPPVRPLRLERAESGWRSPATCELYVDFETVNALGDDFARLPSPGGSALIFQIGAGWWEGREWRFWQRTAARLTPDAELALIREWVELIEERQLASGAGQAGVRLVHWSAAETSTLDTAYTAARSRHGEGWPALPFWDVLERLIHPDPVAVRGAFGWGLKSLARAMHAEGLIETTWGDGPADGLGALAGAFAADAEAAARGCRLDQVDLIGEIARYNEVDCRTMAEIVRWLREHR